MVTIGSVGRDKARNGSGRGAQFAGLPLQNEVGVGMNERQALNQRVRE